MVFTGVVYNREEGMPMELWLLLLTKLTEVWGKYEKKILQIRTVTI